MHAQQRRLSAGILRGELTRRALIVRVVAGLASSGLATIAAACAAPSSISQSPATPTAVSPLALATRATTVAPVRPSGRGVGGTLKILMWAGPTLLNPHVGAGATNGIAARMCCEPLLSVGADGTLIPVLAAEVPSRSNGGLSADGKTVTYRLKKDVMWADGQPFTAQDVVFTYEYVTDKAIAAPTLGSYLDLDHVEAVDPLTVRLTFKEPTGGWYVPFTGTSGVIVPRQALQNYVGANARNAPFNLKAFGTGPFMVTDFKPGDLALMTANPYYREPSKPFFSDLQIKGGGDAVSAGRAVLETGEYDFAYNLQVEAQVLGQLLRGGKGDLVTGPGGAVEQLWFNMANPDVEVDGERSSPKSRHPFLTDQRVRQAMAMAIDRSMMAKQLYGDTGDATANILTTPTSMNSPNTAVEFNTEKANQILDQGGYQRRGNDGMRVTPEGAPMHVLFQTTTNSLRQKEQALIKDGWQKIGIETELKSIDAGVFFSSDPGNPDTNWHFYADVEMSTVPLDSAFPLRYMRFFYGAVPERDWSQKSNNWTGPNVLKWSNTEYNQLFDEVAVQTDPEQSRRTFIRMNDVLVNSYAVVPLVARKSVDAKSKALRGPVRGPFDSYNWNIADWTRD